MRRESSRRRRRRIGRFRTMLGLPLDPSAVHQRHVAVAEVVEDPPQPRSVDTAALVVHDDARRVRDAQLRHLILKGHGRWEKGRRRLRVANGDGREIHRAGHVTFAESALPHVDDADGWIGGVRRNPVGVDELFRMRVRHGEQRKQWKHAPECTRTRCTVRTRPANLSGASVVGASAGLAGLWAARDLIALGANVTVLEARDRVGGRVWTVRDGFAEGQHAEAGGDMIDEAQDEIRALAGEVGLTLTRILRGGFAYVQLDASGKPRIVSRDVARGWDHLERTLDPAIRPYRLAEQRWDTPIATALARRSVAGWLDELKADADLRATAMGMRGFFLADPEELSLIALVDQFASETSAGPWNMYRINGGNDALATALAKPLGERLHLRTELVAVSHRGRAVRVTVKNSRSTAQIACDYLVLALPATIVRRIPISPALPAQQHDAIARLKYGRGTKTLLQFSRRFWRIPGRPRAFGSPLPFGAFRSEEHTSELQSRVDLVCRLLLEKKNEKPPAQESPNEEFLASLLEAEVFAHHASYPAIRDGHPRVPSEETVVDCDCSAHPSRAMP